MDASPAPASPALPVNDHCDGRVFFNPATLGGRNSGTRRLLAIMRWWLSGTRSQWPAHVVDPPPPGDPHATVPDGMAGVTFIGHSSFHLRLGGLSVLTDPVWSRRCSPVAWAGPTRARAPGRTLDALPRIDLVLVSHNHYDHLDLATLRAVVARDDPMIVTPLGNGALLAKTGTRRVRTLDWWQETEVADGVRVTVTPARHFSARTPFDRNRALWGGFMLDQAGHRVLFAGDSGAGPHWTEIQEQLGAPDLALLPVGAYDPRVLMASVHMDPEEALAAHQALQARRSVGMHFGTFQLTDEPIGEPVARLAAACAAAGLAPDTFTTMGFGETRHIPLVA